MAIFSPRPHQRRLRDVTLAKIARGEREIVAHIHAASGKTAGVLDTANALRSLGTIDAVAIFTPRLNLCTQFELDWQAMRPLYAGRAMGPIVRRDNVPPLIRGDAAGYVGTYSALVAAHDSVAGNIHLEVARRHRLLLVVDEAQFLGVDGDGGGAGTRSAEIVAALAREAVATILLTGTPYRADGLPLVLARYADPDPEGRSALLADVEASYAEGVAERYLRPVEFSLIDGVADIEYVAGAGRDRLVLSQARGGLRRLLEHPNYWRRMVDRTVEQVRRLQEVDARLCGLVAANNQAHAQAIRAYLEGRYPDLRALLAVSDDARAGEHLQAFRRGGYDLLITVRMAHIGYDHPPISAVCVLTEYRASGFLRQLLARGLRMMRDIPAERQMLHAIVPDDPLMAAFVGVMRGEVAEGLRARSGQEPSGRGVPRVAVTVDASATTERTAGLRPDGDLTARETLSLARLQREYGLGGASLSGLSALLRAGGMDIEALADASSGAPRALCAAPGAQQGGADEPPSQVTEQQRERAMRRELREVLGHCDARLRRVVPEWRPGGSASACKQAFGGQPAAACSVQELMERLRWAVEVWSAQVDARTRT